MKKNVIAIGIFDGVHRGHQEIVHRAREVSSALSLELLAVTFYPHPTAILAPTKQPLMLQNIKNRIELLKKTGVDDVEVITFTKDFSTLSPNAFIEDILISQLNGAHIIVGENFTFGSRAAGSVTDIRRYLEADSVPLLRDSVGVISSTRIRGAIAVGEIEQANKLLGRLYSLQGEVIHGEKRGREIGYPTANLEQLPGMAIPPDGIYAGFLIAAKEAYPAAISIGTNPTFPPSFPGERPSQVEAHALGRDDLELYGEVVSVEFISRLRPTIKFPELASLLAQMAKDCQQVREIIAQLGAKPARW